MYITQMVFWTCTIVEAVSVMLFIMACVRFKVKNNYLAILFETLFYLLLTYTFREIYEMYTICLYFMILLCCRFLYEGNIIKHMSITVGVLAANIFSRFVALVYVEMLHGTLSDTVVLSEISSGIVFFVWKSLNIIMLWLLYIIVRRAYKTKLKETVLEVILLFVNLIISTIFILWSKENGISNDSKCFVDAILLTVFVVSYVYLLILHYTNNNNKAEKENHRLENYIKEQQKNLIRIEEDYYNARKLRHDISKMSRIYIGLLKENKVEQVIDEIGKQIEDIPPRFCVYVKDNNSINVVINEKKDVCIKLGIDLRVQITAQIKSEMEMDVAVMIYNLLDNAIETQKDNKKEAKIVINIFESGEMYNVVVKNTIREPVFKNNPGLNTSKENTLYHGIGLKSIKDTVDKYEGIIDFEENEEQFIVHVALPI